MLQCSNMLGDKLGNRLCNSLGRKSFYYTIITIENEKKKSFLKTHLKYLSWWQKYVATFGTRLIIMKLQHISYSHGDICLPKGVPCNYMAWPAVSVHDLVRFVMPLWWTIHVGSLGCEFRPYAMSGHRAWWAFHLYHVDVLVREICNSSVLEMNPLVWWWHRNMDYLLSTLNPYTRLVCMTRHKCHGLLPQPIMAQWCHMFSKICIQSCLGI